MSQGVANETVASLKSKLNAWGVAIPPRAKKADLVALFLANQNRSNLPTHPPSVRTQDEALSLKSLFRLIPVSIQAFALLGVFQIIFMTMHLAFSTTRSTTPTSTFVPRHDYSRAIDDFIETSNSRYMVVIGPRGCGKSSIVSATLSSRYGVISRQFGGEATRDAVFKSFYWLSWIPPYFISFSSSHQSIVGQLLRWSSYWHVTKDANWRPIIIAEVMRGISDNAIREVATAVKALAVDERAAHVILVLSDANAAFSLPDDPDRQELLWVEDLTEEEAHSLLDHYNFFLRHKLENGSVINGDTNAQFRTKLFSSIGTRAATLVAAVTKSEVTDSESERSVVSYNVATVEEFITMRLNQARATVQRLSTLKSSNRETSGAAFSQLLLDLLIADESGVPEGVADKYLVRPSEAARIFKGDMHAVLYHFPSQSYKFHSVPHRIAAQQLHDEGYFSMNHT